VVQHDYLYSPGWRIRDAAVMWRQRPVGSNWQGTGVLGHTGCLTSDYRACTNSLRYRYITSQCSYEPWQATTELVCTVTNVAADSASSENWEC